MARGRSSFKTSFIAENPSPLFHLLSSILFSARKNPRNQSLHAPPLLSASALFLLIFFTCLAISIISFMPIFRESSPPCSSLLPPDPYSSILLSSRSDSFLKEDGQSLSSSAMVPLPAHWVSGNMSAPEKEFWRQPDGEGYRPCLEFGIKYRKASVKISKEKRRFLVVVASGGLNQQRNQIVDAVVIARILEAALVVPILQVNFIWGDDSEFADIFDVKHFKRTLEADVRVVSSLPSSHLMSRQSIETRIPHNISPLWIRTRFFKQLNEEGLIVLKGLDSKLSKNLPPDLQKLRCKVAFHALRFASPIQELGNKLAKRMWIEGPYIGLHLRLEKDVWVRTGCLTGLGPEYDDTITNIRDSRPEYLTGRLNMTYTQRRLTGLCPLNALEVARLLKALGAPSSARVYIAGGSPFGGTKAVEPLRRSFPSLVTKEMLARGDELTPYLNRSSALAALDYIVSLSSEVFLPSHGGNMARAMQGHRAYVGHRKYIRPDKRVMLPFFEDGSISDDELGIIMRKLHKKLIGQPEPRTNKRDRDVIGYPVPECMCKHSTRGFL